MSPEGSQMTLLIFGKSMIYLGNRTRRIMRLGGYTDEDEEPHLFNSSDFMMLVVLFAGTRTPSTCSDVRKALRSKESFIHRFMGGDNPHCICRFVERLIVEMRNLCRAIPSMRVTLQVTFAVCNRHYHRSTSSTMSSTCIVTPQTRTLPHRQWMTWQSRSAPCPRDPPTNLLYEIWLMHTQRR